MDKQLIFIIFRFLKEFIQYNNQSERDYLEIEKKTSVDNCYFSFYQYLLLFFVYLKNIAIIVKIFYLFFFFALDD